MGRFSSEDDGRPHGHHHHGDRGSWSNSNSISDSEDSASYEEYDGTIFLSSESIYEQDDTEALSMGVITGASFALLGTLGLVILAAYKYKNLCPTTKGATSLALNEEMTAKVDLEEGTTASEVSE